MWPWRRKKSVIRFAYKRYRGESAPVILVKILAKRRWRKVFAYVDSGAAYSILSVAEADRLGLLDIKARRVAVTSSGGRTLRISLHRLWVRIGNDRLSITFGIPRDFDVDCNLLGRRDLFRRYVVSFDDTRAILTFAPHRK